jgi:hypothetical protein
MLGRWLQRLLFLRRRFVRARQIRNFERVTWLGLSGHTLKGTTFGVETYLGVDGYRIQAPGGMYYFVDASTLEKANPDARRSEA